MTSGTNRVRVDGYLRLQINENINLGANWRIVETEAISHGLMLNLGFQQATQTQNSAVENAGSRFMNGSGGYQYGLKDLNLILL